MLDTINRVLLYHHELDRRSDFVSVAVRSIPIHPVAGLKVGHVYVLLETNGQNRGTDKTQSGDILLRSDCHDTAESNLEHIPFNNASLIPLRVRY
jgi:hypothetical protein